MSTLPWPIAASSQGPHKVPPDPPGAAAPGLPLPQLLWAFPEISLRVPDAKSPPENPADAALLETRVGPLRLANPVMSASGTYGSGWEGRGMCDLSQVGALVSKTVTPRPRPGNPPQRIHETASGMLNSIGLENRGLDYFLEVSLPRMRSLDRPVVINIGGDGIEDFVHMAEAMTAAGGVDALEVNLSCPNVQGGKLLFSSDAAAAREAMAAVRGATSLPVFAKLSPNVTKITDIAVAAVEGGADGLTAINTLIGMAVDWRQQRPVLGRTIGGLSGPAIKPVALRMVYEIRKVVDVPILGVGGITTAEDVLEFLAAGASAVQVGTANFADPTAMSTMVADLSRLLRDEGRTVATVQHCLHGGTAATSEPSKGQSPRVGGVR